MERELSLTGAAYEKAREMNTIAYERFVWNILTGNARVEPGNLFCIEEVNDKESQKAIRPILPSKT
jgi:hypothetical protein